MKKKHTNLASYEENVDFLKWLVTKKHKKPITYSEIEDCLLLIKQDLVDLIEEGSLGAASSATYNLTVYFNKILTEDKADKASMHNFSVLINEHFRLDEDTFRLCCNHFLNPFDLSKGFRKKLLNTEDKIECGTHIISLAPHLKIQPKHWLDFLELVDPVYSFSIIVSKLNAAISDGAEGPALELFCNNEKFLLDTIGSPPKNEQGFYSIHGTFIEKLKCSGAEKLASKLALLALEYGVGIGHYQALDRAGYQKSKQWHYKALLSHTETESLVGLLDYALEREDGINHRFIKCLDEDRMFALICTYLARKDFSPVAEANLSTIFKHAALTSQDHADMMLRFDIPKKYFPRKELKKHLEQDLGI